MTSPRPMQFQELIQIVRFRRKLVGTFIGFALIGAVFKELVYIPTFTGQTTLLVQKAEQSPMQMALANLGAASFDQSEKVQKYLMYLNSSEFSLAVAETLKFHESYHLLNLTQPSELSVFRKKFWVSYVQSKIQGSTKSGAEELEPVLIPVNELASIIQNVTVAEATSTDTIRIKLTTMDAFTSMVLVNTIADVFVRKTGERDYNEVAEVKRFIQGQLEQRTERLKRSELGLVEFKKRHNIISINTEHQNFSNRMTTMDTELNNQKVKFQENQRLIEYYEGILKKAEQRILSQGSQGIKSTPSELAMRLRQQMDSLRYKKVLMQAQGYAEDSWQMLEINGEIDKTATLLKEQLSNPESLEGDDEPMVTPEVARQKLAALKNENKALDSKIAALEKNHLTMLKSLEALPKDEQVLLTLTRDVDLQFELYSGLKKKLQEVEIQQVALQSRISVIEHSALPPPVPRTNFILKIFFAILVGLFLGSTIAFGLEAIDPTVKHIADLEQMEIISLGSIPHVEGSEMRRNLGRHAYRPDLLVCKNMPESKESMAFKYIRAQLPLITAADGMPARVIAVTGALQGDGKSFVTSNLAISLTQLEKKVLLIDCDLREPSLHFFFGFREGTGLSSLLSLKNTLEEVLHKNVVPGLDILPSGWCPPNPTELISSQKFRILLEHLKSQYDMILLDCPAAIPVVDSSVLAALADGVILTSAFRKTRRDHLFQSMQKIMKLSHKHIYGVLNNVWDRPDEASTPWDNDLGSGVDNQADSEEEVHRFKQSLESTGRGSAA